MCTCMWRVAVWSVLLIAIASAEPCQTCLYPSGDGQFLSGILTYRTVVVCNNETCCPSLVYCLTLNGDAIIVLV